MGLKLSRVDYMWAKIEGRLNRTSVGLKPRSPRRSRPDLALRLNRTSVGLKLWSRCCAEGLDWPWLNRTSVGLKLGVGVGGTGVSVWLNRTSVGLKHDVDHAKLSPKIEAQSNQRGIETPYGQPYCACRSHGAQSNQRGIETRPVPGEELSEEKAQSNQRGIETGWMADEPIPRWVGSIEPAWD